MVGQVQGLFCVVVETEKSMTYNLENALHGYGPDKGKRFAKEQNYENSIIWVARPHKSIGL